MTTPEYSHMCRDGHPQIGHNDSSSEMCPLCRAIAERDQLREERDAWRETVEAATRTLANRPASKVYRWTCGHRHLAINPDGPCPVCLAHELNEERRAKLQPR